jgi:hypothetical protein
VIIVYCGKRVEDLTREELIEALNLAAEEASALRRELEKMRPHVDWIAYLLQPQKE